MDNITDIRSKFDEYLQTFEEVLRRSGFVETARIVGNLRVDNELTEDKILMNIAHSADLDERWPLDPRFQMILTIAWSLQDALRWAGRPESPASTISLAAAYAGCMQLACMPAPF